MPNAVIKSYAEKTGNSVEHVEAWWDEAKEQAAKKFKKKDKHFWAYVNGIVKRRAGVSEETSFKEFLMILSEFAKPEPDDEDLGSWKKLPYANEFVYYDISLVSMRQPGYGLQVKIAMEPYAANAESEFINDKTIAAHGKTADELGPQAKTLVLKWLDEHGTEPLHKAIRDWARETELFHSREDAIKKRSPTGLKLPPGYKIVAGEHKGTRFVKTPDNWLIPNQGINDYESDQDLIDNLYYWLEKQKG